MSHNNPTPVAVCLVPVIDGDREYLLGIVRATPPIGGAAFAGGYVEPMETAAMAASRELEEETNVVISAEHWHLRYERITPKNILLLFCVSDVKLTRRQVEALKPTAEASAYLLFEPGSELVFPTHQEVNDEYFQHAA